MAQIRVSASFHDFVSNAPPFGFDLRLVSNPPQRLKLTVLSSLPRLQLGFPLQRRSSRPGCRDECMGRRLNRRDLHLRL